MLPNLHEVREGEVVLLVPKAEKVSAEMEVFYNPAKAFDRDLAVAFLRAFRELAGRDLTVCDLLTASGVRGIRYACEVDGLREVWLNDLSAAACQLAARNVELNRDKLRCPVEISNKEASVFLLSVGKRFDFIDLDPFGSPNPFLDASVRALRRKALLGVTSTDTACLCGTYPRTCLRKYGSLPARTEYRDEIGLRILAKKVIEVGAQYEVALEPVFGYFLGSHFRIYLRSDEGAGKVDRLLDQVGFIAHCFRCLWRSTLRRGESLESCPRCQGRLELIGPIFIGQLWDAKLCEGVLRASRGRVTGLALTINAERRVRTVGYFTVDSLCRKLGIREPPLGELLRELEARGFPASRTHFNPKGFRTEAPIEEVERVLRSLEA